MTQPLIVCCSPSFADGWRKLGPTLTRDEARWTYFDDRPTFFWEGLLRRPNVAMMRACLQAVFKASRDHARLLITHDPRAAFWCAFFCQIFSLQVDHYVDSFNFSNLPTGIERLLMRHAFRQVQKFAVHSSMERTLYSQYFDIPLEKIRLRLWSIDIPEVTPDFALQQGRYVSAIGGNGRDYKTLLEACRLLPEISFVLVVRPENMVGLTVPGNVTVLVDTPFGEAMNVMRYSAFTVLPLANSNVPCGHVTLVCAMHLGKTVVATDSTGISDYVFPGFNGVVCEPGSAESLAQKIRELWNDPAESHRLAVHNQRFGAENCSEARIRSDLASVLTEWDIPIFQEALLVEAFPAV